MGDRAAIGAGLLGDTRTAALVDPFGSVDWLCLPHFDGEPVFARLLAGQDGGSFRLGPAGDAEVVQRRYRPGSTELETTWQVGAARLILIEGMVAESRRTPVPDLLPRSPARSPWRSNAGRGVLRPRFGVERRAPRTRSGRTGFVCTDGGVALSFTADRDFVPAPGRVAEFELAPNQPLTIAFTAAHSSPLKAVAPELAWRALLEDEARWRGWSRAIDFGLL